MRGRGGIHHLRATIVTMRPKQPTEPKQQRAERSARGALLAYIAAWLVGAAVVVGVVFAALGGRGTDTVSVPPVRETELTSAAGMSRCVLHTAAAGEQTNPPVDGPGGVPPARPGIYDKPVASARLTAAVRHGIVVIQFRKDLDAETLQSLKTLQTAIPTGTIVAPNATGMQFQVAVVAYRRLLGCPRLSTHTLDAVQLFRGRFLGSGPEAL